MKNVTEWNLQQYDGRFVRIEDSDGTVFTGLAGFFPAGYGLSEFGKEEESLKVGKDRFFSSNIRKIELTEVHGTAELQTERLILRRYLPEDAGILFKEFGSDEAMYRYTGWNPYASEEMAERTVQMFIDSYADPHSYGWAVESEGILIGTIGAYDYDQEKDSIEVGISIRRSFWGKGFAGEVIKTVLKYLTGNEGISCVKAWCAADNTASMKAMESAGMKRVREEKGGINTGGSVYDKLYYELRV